MPVHLARISRLTAFFVVVAAFLLAPIPGRDAGASTTCTKYASPAGSDVNSGSAAAPFLTAQRLINNLSAGQTGCLYAGTYVGNATFSLGSVTLASVPGDRAKLAGYIWVKSTANGVTISGLDVDGHDVSPPPIQVHGDGVTLSGLNVTNRNKPGLTYNAMCVLAGSEFETSPVNTAYGLVVRDSRIHNCGDDAHEHAIYLESTRNATVQDNYLYANPGYGVHMYPDAQGTLIEGNVIDGNSSMNKANLTFSGESPGGEYALPHGSDNNTVRYNLITNALTRYNVESYFPQGSVSPVNNVVYENCISNAPMGNFGSTAGYTQWSNMDVDPLYVDRAQGDFQLQAGSPCAGYGPSANAGAPPPPPPAPAPDFALSASPSSQSVIRGASVTYSVSVVPANGFAGLVALSVTGAPGASSASFSSSLLDASVSTASSLVLGTTSSTPTGTFSLIVKGVGGSIDRTATLTLQVRKPMGKKRTLTQAVTGSPTLLKSSTLSVKVTTTDPVSGMRMHARGANIGPRGRTLFSALSTPTRHAVAGVRVRIWGAGVSARSLVTGRRGRVTFRVRPSARGPIYIRSSKPGFTTTTRVLRVRGG